MPIFSRFYCCFLPNFALFCAPRMCPSIGNSIACFLGTYERCIESLNKRSSEAKTLMISPTKFGLSAASAGSVVGDSPLAAEEKIHRRVLLGKALRWSRESEALECVHEAMQLLVVEEATDFFVMMEEVGANGEELIALGHVYAGSDNDFLCGDVEVEAATPMFFQVRRGTTRRQRCVCRDSCQRRSGCRGRCASCTFARGACARERNPPSLR